MTVRLVFALVLLAASALAGLVRVGPLEGAGGEGVTPLLGPAASGAGGDPAAPPAAGAGVYPAAPSAPVPISPARRRFIARVDRTCARTAARGRAAQAFHARRVAGRPDAPERVTRFLVRQHARQYRALRALGRPPEARLAYARWLENLRARVRLEGRYAPLVREGRAAEARALAQEVAVLKARGNVLGRRFGLRRCAG